MSSTTDPGLRSFVPVAAGSHFPIQNLPYGVFRTDGRPRVGVAIGEMVLDLALLERRGLLPTGNPGEPVFDRPSLNTFLALGPAAWRPVRAALSALLRDDVPTLRDDERLRREALAPLRDAELLLPLEIGDYTDFYAARDHATNVGMIFRGPENALPPNWLHLPIAYHGRSSSVVASGTEVRRPCGQTLPPNAERPVFGPTQALDYELEFGCVIGMGNPLGAPIPVDRALEHVFGFVLVNDWSARDIQRWEYVPLGPFLGKNFATTVSPWVVTRDALEPFLVPAPPQDPPPIDYLRETRRETYDVRLEAWLEPRGAARQPICATNLRRLYWTAAQMIAHHTVNGCNLRPGDLLASGTVSGPTPAERGCLLEATWGGRQPLALPSGESRVWLEDGDAVTLTGWCERDGLRIGFGEAFGRIAPAT